MAGGSGFFSDPSLKRILLSKDGRWGGGRGGQGRQGLGRGPPGSGGLGLEVAGGQFLPGANGEVCAYVKSVTKGGTVETLGEVREGDEILEWNGTVLRGKTAEEVARVVAASSGEIEVLIRSGANLHTLGQPISQQQRSLNLTEQRRHHNAQQHLDAQTSTLQGHQHHPSYQPQHGQQSHQSHQSHQSQQSQQSQQSHHGQQGSSQLDQGLGQSGESSRRQRQRLEAQGDVVPVRDPGLGPAHSAPPVPPHNDQHLPLTPTVLLNQNQDYDYVGSGLGALRVAVSFDKATGTLFACVLGGRELGGRTDGQPPNPFVKVYLLPGRSVEKKRRTKYQRATSAPEWNQTVVYKDLGFAELPAMWLELSVWDYDKASQGQNTFLGQLILPLEDPEVVSGQPRWYALEPRGQDEQGQGLDPADQEPLPRVDQGRHVDPHIYDSVPPPPPPHRLPPHDFPPPHDYAHPGQPNDFWPPHLQPPPPEIF